MPHARQQIRDQIVTTVTGLATTGSNVFSTRVWPHEGGVLPSLNVRNGIEAIDNDASTLDIETRSLDIQIEARVKSTGSIDDELDDICAEVETAIMADDTLGGLVKWIELAQTEFDDSREVDQPAGLAVMTWRCLYRVDPSDPTTIVS